MLSTRSKSVGQKQYPKRSTRSSLPARDAAHSRQAAAIGIADQASLAPRASVLGIASVPKTLEISQKQIRDFQKMVWRFWENEGRHNLPWRKTHDAYKILVSEVMLQQTQVERVIPYYRNFLKKFSNVRELAAAPLSEVLIAWQGLGYNRRAKMLHMSAKDVVEKCKGKFPKTVEELESLPGIGHYTARAIAAFSYNQPVVFIETNLRTVITHHFFSDKEQVEDKEIMEILSKVYPKPTPERGAREWYAALMDYGSHLKRSGVRINAKSKTYTKQSKFAGSDREARGTILKALANSPKTKQQLLKLLDIDRKTQIKSQIQKLEKERLIEKQDNKYHLPS